MRYLSVCSGVEAATAAWHPLGWTPLAFAEIEKFPSAVLAHHYPTVPNLGDITRFKEWPHADIDLLVGGTPCQSFSVAGLRKGLDDPRGNLALTYCAILDKYRPRWFVWENVPGVLSSDGGRAFGSILGAMAELGYGWAYRIIDAQYVRVDGFGRAVPQRRRRVFVVGHLGDWRRPAAVLFERESLRWDSAPRRQPGQRVAPTISARPSGGGGLGLGTDFDCDGGLISSTGSVAHCLNAGAMGRIDYETETMIAHSLRADGFDASEDGTGRGTPLVPIAFDCKASGQSGFGIGEVASTMRAMGHSDSHQNGGGHQAVAFQPRFARNDRGAPSEVAYPLTAEAGKTGKGDSAQCVATNWAVRRLTPRECERLQGFTDGYTRVPIPQTGRKAGPVWAADGPRYKALGNSMAVNAMRWLGRRIEMVRAAVGDAPHA